MLDCGPSTAGDLAERLGLTSAAVRRHLDALLASGIAEGREQRVYGQRGRGRPARVFALTDAGRDAFYQAYDQLAVDALSWIAEAAGGGAAGQEAVAAFARARFAAQAQRYQQALEQADPAARARVLAEALTADGYAATARSTPTSKGTRQAAEVPGPAGEQLCQHHCPVAHVAERYPQLCEAETEVFSELLGTHVQRLATIAHGDGVCTTYVPPSPSHVREAESSAQPDPHPAAASGDGAASRETNPRDRPERTDADAIESDSMASGRKPV